jgi:hypothetical protein
VANEEHLKILEQGVEVWNRWRRENPEIIPDLANGDFRNRDFSGANFCDANFHETDLVYTNFTGANLKQANLDKSNLDSTILNNADLLLASLVAAEITDANLSGAVLRYANLLGTGFFESKVDGASFDGASMSYTSFGNMDLSTARDLEKVFHFGASTIGIDTLYKSAGKIPEAFLRGCGVPDDFITFIPSHFGIQQAIQFYSCFISYSTKDEEFARRLYSRMRDEKLRVWFAPEDMKGGEKLHEQIERAIQLHDRLLIILSEESMASEWVMTEIRRARKTEIEQNRRKLFPILLVDFEAVKKWKCFDSDSGKDLAVELREYFMPDFSNWKDHDSFEEGFERLLRDLRAEEEKQAEKRDRK